MFAKVYYLRDSFVGHQRVHAAVSHFRLCQWEHLFRIKCFWASVIVVWFMHLSPNILSHDVQVNKTIKRQFIEPKCRYIYFTVTGEY